MAKTPSYILELRILTNKSAANHLLRRFFLAERLYNNLVRYAEKQLKRMRENKTYKRILREYLNAKDKSMKKQLSEQLNAIKMSYGLTKYQLEAYAYNCNKDYCHLLDSDTRSKISYRVSKAVDSVMYKSGKHLHFKKYGTLMSLEGKKNSNGIRYKDGFFIWGRNLKLRTKFKKNDLFILEALADKVKYCRIIKRPHGSGYRFYLQLVMEGTAPSKRNKDGSFRESCMPANEGRVGLDIGTSTIAISSERGVMLQQLAPDICKADAEIERLQRKLDRSSRANNPQNYNSDGTIKKGPKKWNRSKSYFKTLFKLKALHSKRSRIVKQHHYKLVNDIKKLGNQVFYEKVSVEGQKRKAKKTERSDKESIVKNKVVHKYKRKKRFGKSVQTYAPAAFLEKLSRKVKLTEIVLSKFRASQYDHITDTYTKKKLSQRRTKVGDDIIQRDLYSSFLLMNAADDLAHPDRELCCQTYSQFKKEHDLLISQYKKEKQEGRKFLSCMGI